MKKLYKLGWKYLYDKYFKIIFAKRNCSSIEIWLTLLRKKINKIHNKLENVVFLFFFQTMSKSKPQIIDFIWKNTKVLEYIFKSLLLQTLSGINLIKKYFAAVYGEKSSITGF